MVWKNKRGPAWLRRLPEQETRETDGRLSSMKAAQLRFYQLVETACFWEDGQLGELVWVRRISL